MCPLRKLRQLFQREKLIAIANSQATVSCKNTRTCRSWWRSSRWWCTGSASRARGPRGPATARSGPAHTVGHRSGHPGPPRPPPTTTAAAVAVAVAAAAAAPVGPFRGPRRIDCGDCRPPTRRSTLSSAFSAWNSRPASLARSRYLFFCICKTRHFLPVNVGIGNVRNGGKCRRIGS